jgi:lipoprotein-releasing system ATP-binding protein
MENNTPIIEKMVSVENLTKTFKDDSGDFDVIKDASFFINKGEMISLVGVSGAGKTTLLQILGGLDKANSGTIIISNSTINTMSQHELAHFRNKRIGFVFQFHHLLSDFTALENVMIPGIINGKSKESCLPRARELLGIFGLDRQGTHHPSELSGGECQRVALARALFNEPALILADEPTGNLDPENSKILLELIIKANKELNQTFLVATHNPEISRGMQRTIYIENNKIIRKD